MISDEAELLLVSSAQHVTELHCLGLRSTEQDMKYNYGQCQMQDATPSAA